MNKKTELVYAINALFAVCNLQDLDPEKIPQRMDTINALEELDYGALLQALRFNAETVFTYTAENCDFDCGCNYYGPELFPCRATRIYSYSELDEIAQEMELDMDKIAANLLEMAEAYYEDGMPTYEL